VINPLTLHLDTFEPPGPSAGLPADLEVGVLRWQTIRKRLANS
jgi:hypothetical protein